MSHIIRELFEAVVLALIVFFVIQISVQNFRVEGKSMQPTLEEKEYLMVNKLTYLRVDLRRLARLIPFWSVERKDERHLPFTHPPSRGDIVVFREPIEGQRDFVKRIIGIPGDHVQIRERADSVYVNGVKLEETYLPSGSKNNWNQSCRAKPVNCNMRLQKNQYYALGDNRRNSNDSRSWGAVSEENIIGKVWFVYWPLCQAPLIGSLIGDCE